MSFISTFLGVSNRPERKFLVNWSRLEFSNFLVCPDIQNRTLNFLERVNGIEPSSPGWKPGVITIIRHPHVQKELWNDTRKSFTAKGSLLHFRLSPFHEYRSPYPAGAPTRTASARGSATPGNTTRTGAPVKGEHRAAAPCLGPESGRHGIRR